MQLEIRHPDFQQQRLSVKTPGLFSGTTLFVNGVLAKPEKGVYEVINDAGAPISIRLKPSFPDHVPTVMIGEELIRLARPLTWYEYAWCGIPIILLLGGAIGGGIGGTAAYLNLRTIRMEQGIFVRYGLVGVTTFLAFLAYTVAVVILHILTNRPIVPH